ncbi:hypothetical protein [Paenibacillus caui]|uniref:hypothetical protein n=1 Tax=Paenibacillus caui TaxID=2873927 RepID=UPI001CA8DAD1|nr:hypothetical protein [Paenibacillus caui]
MKHIVSRLTAMGYKSVPSENPYWDQSGVTICDPDGLENRAAKFGRAVVDKGSLSH